MASPVPTTPERRERRDGSLVLRRGQLCAIIGAFSAAFSLWLFPIFLGIVAIALGTAAILRGEPRGRWVIVAAFVCVPLGLFIAWLPADVVGR
jgi:hypothetical protein